MNVCKLSHTYLVCSQRLLDCEENKEKRISSTQQALQLEDQLSPLLDVICLLKTQDGIGRANLPGQESQVLYITKNTHFSNFNSEYISPYKQGFKQGVVTRLNYKPFNNNNNNNNKRQMRKYHKCRKVQNDCIFILHVYHFFSLET